jgi:6-pyruvoyltetrahydropterin/6-carboxytetrahydropterin synthase
VLEATLEGDVNPVRGQSDDGMVLDFSAVKMIMTEHVHDLFDHAFIIYSGDTTGVQALKLLGSEHRTVIVDFVPTAENLASFIFEMLDFRFKSHYNRGQLRLTRVRLYETPTSWADVTRP